MTARGVGPSGGGHAGRLGGLSGSMRSEANQEDDGPGDSWRFCRRFVHPHAVQLHEGQQQRGADEDDAAVGVAGVVRVDRGGRVGHPLRRLEQGSAKVCSRHAQAPNTALCPELYPV